MMKILSFSPTLPNSSKSGVDFQYLGNSFIYFKISVNTHDRSLLLIFCRTLRLFFNGIECCDIQRRLKQLFFGSKFFVFPGISCITSLQEFRIESILRLRNFSLARAFWYKMMSYFSERMQGYFSEIIVLLYCIAEMEHLE